MGFRSPQIHRVTNITASAMDVEGTTEPFTWLTLTFQEEDGTRHDMSAVFLREHMSRAHAIASAITLSQHALRDAAE